MKLKPIKNTFIFKFMNSLNNKGQFNKDTTESGILLQASFDDSAKETRWVSVTEVGHECKDIRVGSTALLPALRWTSGVKFEGTNVWKSDEMQAVAILDPIDSVVIPLRDTVIFEPIKSEEITSAFGIVLVKDPEQNTPRGVVTHVGPDCIDATIGDIVYYDDTNFFDTFKHAGVAMAFIKEDKIVVLG